MIKVAALARTYQLVRNVLAATVRQDRVETAFRHPGLLRTVSWQRIIGQLSAVRDLRWLLDGLEAKYRLTTPANTLPTPLEALQVC